MIQNLVTQDQLDEVKDNVDQLNTDLTASDNLKFRFATDGEGNHGYLGADDSFIPFKSGGNATATLLWENPSPKSDYYGGDITFNESAEDFNMIAVLLQSETRDTWKDPIYTLAIAFKENLNYLAVSSYNNSNYLQMRRITKISNTGLTFNSTGTLMVYDNGTKWSEYKCARPLKVWGFKLDGIEKL